MLFMTDPEDEGFQAPKERSVYELLQWRSLTYHQWRFVGTSLGKTLYVFPLDLGVISCLDFSFLKTPLGTLPPVTTKLSATHSLSQRLFKLRLPTSRLFLLSNTYLFIVLVFFK